MHHFAPTVECISLSGSPLANFKQRFKPGHSFLLLMYQDLFWLLARGLAVTEAYLPTTSLCFQARLVRRR